MSNEYKPTSYQTTLRWDNMALTKDASELIHVFVRLIQRAIKKEYITPRKGVLVITLMVESEELYNERTNNNTKTRAHGDHAG